MKVRTRKLATLAAAALIAAPAAAGDFAADASFARGRGKLDLDIYSPGGFLPRAPGSVVVTPLGGWTPGDPRAERGDPAWVKHLSHVGYAGLGAAGLAASVASGAAAPAIGFGIVAVVQSLLEWRQIKNPPADRSD